MNKTLIFLILYCSMSLLSVPAQSDKPLKGEWDFRLEKVWQTDRAGDDILARITTLLVSETGHIYISDRKHKTSFILDTGGKLIKAFARRGEGPGEVRYHMQAYQVGGKFIIADFDRLHYFTLEGEFIRTVRNVFFKRRPVLFLSEDEFIAAPINLFQTTEKSGGIIKVNLKTGKETVISRFNVFTGGSLRERGGPAREVIIVGLSPLMTIGRSEDKLYYGMSDNYTIEVADLNGRKLKQITLDRKKQRVSYGEKKKLIEGIPNTTEEVVKHLMENIPDDMTFFYRLEVHNGLIFVFVPDPLHRFPGHWNPAQIDIFSADGKYLYRSRLKLPGGVKPLTTFIHKNYLYLTLEDEAGDTGIAKYKIRLPDN